MVLLSCGGDVYLIGCTNVGKSTLFNALLQSDFCKVEASELIQKATTSLWPGTTLNLLKFPILRPSGWRLFVRTKRLISLNKIKSQEEQLRKIQLKKTQNSKYATLIGHIEKTFIVNEEKEKDDFFSVHAAANVSGKTKVGINENDYRYKLSKWCYDTPGVVQPDQILHLLTTEELTLTLPKEMIQPKTFSCKPGSTVFIGGLSRLDYIEGSKSVRLTVFTSADLPITICNTCDADEMYKEFLGSPLFKVPCGNEDRLKQWPKLEAGHDVQVKGFHSNTSSVDIVLSNAGWISVSPVRSEYCSFKPWTPEKRGIYVRESLLPKIVSLRGKKIRHSPAYLKTRYYLS